MIGSWGRAESGLETSGEYVDGGRDRDEGDVSTVSSWIVNDSGLEGSGRLETMSDDEVVASGSESVGLGLEKGHIARLQMGLIIYYGLYDVRGET